METTQITHLHFDKSVNKTFATVRTQHFTAQMYVSGFVTDSDFLGWIEPTVARMNADLVPVVK